MRKSAAKVLLFCRVDKFFLLVWVVVVFKNLTMCLLWLFNFLRSVVALWVGRWCGTVRKIQISCCYVGLKNSKYHGEKSPNATVKNLQMPR